MLDDYTVNITYKNRALQSVHERTYPLPDYCQELKLNLMRTIADVENAFYVLQNEKGKDEWSSSTMDSFQHIRHKLLDVANSVERLPINMRCKGRKLNSMNSADYFAGIIENAATSHKE